MADFSRIAVLGGGLGGYTAVRELRHKGFEGDIWLIDPEGLPYDRPPLSKDYLSGKKSLEDLQFCSQHWLDENRVTLIAQKAISMQGQDPLTVTVEDGSALEVDRVILATGGTARTLSTPGIECIEPLELRTSQDANILREKISAGGTLVIIGGGLIGAEVASSALEFGATVIIVDHSELPLAPAVGEKIAQRLHDLNAEKGVRTIRSLPEKFEKAGEKTLIHLGTGETLEADTVLVGIGISANDALARGAGLTVDDGVVVDETYRSSHPAVYAVGDVARIQRPDGILERRHGHWENAKNSAETAVAALLGQELPQHGAHWFWSDRHGIHLECVGSMTAPGRYIYRESDGNVQAAFMMNEDGTMRGCATIDGGLTVRAARRIIDKGLVVDPNQLSDPAIPLKKLAR